MSTDHLRWRIGITTAPRPGGEVFVNKLIDDLIEEGWDRIHVFAEPGSQINQRPGVKIIQNETTLGVYANWRQGVSRIASGPCNLCAMLQDDIEFRPGLKRYLGNSMVAESLYTPYTSNKDYKPGPDGWFSAAGGWHYCGALFLAARKSFFASSLLELPKKVIGNRNIDAHVGKHLASRNEQLLAHRPTLVQHLADACSTAGHAPNPKVRMGKGYKPGEEIK